MKKIKKTFLYLLGFAFALFAFTVIINLPIFDEDLLPEVQAIKDIKAEPYGENDAYPAFIAINGASGATLKEASEALRSHLNSQISSKGSEYLNKNDYQYMIGSGHDNSWKHSYHSCKSRTDSHCISAVVNDLLANPITDERLLSQLNRYNELLSYTDFNDPRELDFDSPIVAYGNTLKLQRIQLANAYINLSSDEFIAFWQKDYKFWRMTFSKSHIMISKMVSLAALRTNFDSLSTAIKKGAFSQLQLIQLQNNLKNISPAEINMGATFKYEFKSSMKFYDSAKAGWFNFYQPNATHNHYYANIVQKLGNVSQLNAYDFHQFITSEQHKAVFTQEVPWSLNLLYNPTGKMLSQKAMSIYPEYIGRGLDANGMINLLKLQIELTLNPEQKIEQVVEQSKYTNPYTLKPMNYNKETHSIYFDCMDKSSVCELSL